MHSRNTLRTLAGVAGVFATGAAAHAVAFTPGNIVVERIGTGSAALTSVSTAVFLDEYTPTGLATQATVQSLALPTAVSGSNNPLSNSGSAASEGGLSLSADGQYLLVAGYAVAPGTASVASSSTTVAPIVLRDFGIVDSLGNIDTRTTTTAFSGNNVRSAVSPDGTTIYASGGNTGIISLTAGSTGTAGTLISNTFTNTRQLEIYNNQLYVSSASGQLRVGTVGTGLPTTTGNTTAELPGVAVGANTSSSAVGTAVASPYQFVISTLAGGTTPDTLYVADNGYYPTKGTTLGVIEKYNLVSGSYVAAGIVNLPGVTGLIGSSTTVGGVTTETLYASTPTGIFTLTDTGTGNLSGTPTQIATAATNEAFRGLAFAPSSVPEPASAGVMAVGALFLASRRRRV